MIKISGSLDENTKLPKVRGLIAGRLDIDLGDLGLINSGGTRNWLQWIRSLQAEEGVYLHKCPRQFITQAANVLDFLPEGVTVQSLYIPYYCESCGAEELLLVDRKDLNQVADKIICPVCSNIMTLDVLREQFLGILKHAG